MKLREIERSVTSSYHGSKISGSRLSFLTKTVICIDERYKKTVGYSFVPECNQAQESHTCEFFLFFLLYWQKKKSWYLEGPLTWLHLNVFTGQWQIQGRGTGGPPPLQRPSNFPMTIVSSVASGISRLNQPTYIISPKV